MSYETRAYDNQHGDPVVVLVATGTHDVSRLVQLLNRGNVEQVGLGGKVVRQVLRHNGGRAALRLLRDHGGPDFTEEPAPLPEVGQRVAGTRCRNLPVGSVISWVGAGSQAPDRFRTKVDELTWSPMIADQAMYIVDSVGPARVPEVSR